MMWLKFIKFYLRISYQNYKSTNRNFFSALIRVCWDRLKYGQILILHKGVVVRGKENINTNGLLKIGLMYTGFNYKTDLTYLNIQGKLVVGSNFSIGRGCRIDIGTDGVVSIGSGGYINSNTTLIIMHSLRIGNNCIVSWNCQFLDEDFHSISYANKKSTNNGIEIGNNIWIGCGVKIYRGSIIADGCVVASDSIVRGEFKQENCLIAGNPARIIKENIHWQ
jgi:acetyltransferase-like isoleucine patch superfamily enzyme